MGNYGQDEYFIHYTDEQQKNDKNIIKNPCKILDYKRVFPEIADLPLYGVTLIDELVKRFNMDFRPRDFNDEYVLKLRDEYWAEHPEDKRIKDKKDDAESKKGEKQTMSYNEIVKQNPIPTWKESFIKALKESNKDTNSEKAKEYIENCDKVSKIVNKFIANISTNNKVASTDIKALNKELNKFNHKAEFFDTLEADDLYEWLTKVFQAFNKPQLIETLEDTREW